MDELNLALGFVSALPLAVYGVSQCCSHEGVQKMSVKVAAVG